MPRAARIGYIAQETPAGPATPFETVLAADVERAALLHEAETTHDHHRLGEIHERLNAIAAHAAPARAARILVGLGFDEDDAATAARQLLRRLADAGRARRPALLGAGPAAARRALATISTSKRRSGSRISSGPIAATMLIVSHERDLLNNVADHILHLEQGGKTTLYPGGYDAFETQYAERLAQLESARANQAAQRAKLQDYIARNSARACTAKQAQSRVKALARMAPIAAVAEDPSLSFDFPSPAELKPPLVTLDMAAVGYAPGEPVLLAPQPAARSRRPDRPARPQRQRQDHARPPARRAAAGDGQGQ